MLKQLCQLEHKIGERVYHLVCAPDSPLGEIKDALFQFTAYVGKIEESIKAQQEKAKAETDASNPNESGTEPKPTE